MVISKDEKQVSTTAGNREREGQGEGQERLKNMPEMQNKQLSLGTSTIFHSFLLSHIPYFTSLMSGKTKLVPTAKVSLTGLRENGTVLPASRDHLSDHTAGSDLYTKQSQPACLASSNTVSFLLRCKTETLPWSHSQSTKECSTSDFNRITCNKIQKMKT